MICIILLIPFLGYPCYNSTLITDELLRLLTLVIPISEWKRIAYEALDLTVNEVDAIESAQTRADVIFNLLHQAVQRDQMPAKDLKQKIEDARKDEMKIGHEGLESFDSGDGKLTHTTCSNSSDMNNKVVIIYYNILK